MPYFLQKRFEIFKDPSFSIPIVKIACTGTIIDHKIDATSASKNLSRANDITTAANMFTWLGNIKVDGASIGSLVCQEEAWCRDQGMVSIIDAAFDDQDLERWVCFSETTRNY